MLTIFKYIFLLLCYSRFGISIKGKVTANIAGSRFSCSTTLPTSYIASSQSQCVQRCLRKEGCKTINYRQDSDSKTSQYNCEIHQKAIHSPSCSMLADTKWKTIALEVAERSTGYDTCKNVYEDKGMVSDGVYKLKSGKHYCMMSDLEGCGPGGWTLAMKINGSKDTFAVGSSYWTNESTYNVENGLKSLEYGEAKFPVFNSTSFRSLCIGMKFAGATKWMRIPYNGESLLAMFKQGNYKATALGKSKWKGLISGASMQPNCNKEGFNVKSSANVFYGRIAIISNQENDCSSPDSMIGLGLINSVLCSSGPTRHISCGNYASCYPDNGDKSSPALCYLLIQ